MKTVGAWQARRSLKSTIAAAQEEPVTITRRGVPVAVVVSPEQYEVFAAIEDAAWAERAREAEKSGYLGPEESMAAIRRILESQE